MNLIFGHRLKVEKGIVKSLNIESSSPSLSILSSFQVSGLQVTIDKVTNRAVEYDTQVGVSYSEMGKGIDRNIT